MYCYIIGHWIMLFCLFGVGYGSLISRVRKVIQESHLYLCSGLSMFCFRSWFSARITPIRYRIIIWIIVMVVLFFSRLGFGLVYLRLGRVVLTYWLSHRLLRPVVKSTGLCSNPDILLGLCWHPLGIVLGFVVVLCLS